MPVTVQFSGDESQLSAAMSKIIAQQERMERGFQKTSKASEPITGHLWGQVKAIGAMAAAYFSVEAALGAVIGKIKEKEALEAKAAGRAMALVNPQRGFLDALGATSPAAQEASIKRLQDHAARTKIPIGAVYTEAALGLRLTGRDEARTLKLMELASQMEPGSAEDREAMLESGIAIMKFRGVKDEKEAMALADLIGDSMGVVEPKRMVKQITQVMASIKGATAVEAGALMVAFSQASGDKTGKGLAEAGEKIGTALDELLPAQTRRDPKTGKVRRGIGVEGFANQIEWLRNATPTQRERFFAEAGIEGKFGQGFRDLASGAPGVATDSYRKFMAEAPGAAAGWDAQAALLNRPFIQKFGASGRNLSALEEGLADTSLGRSQAMAGQFSLAKLKEITGMTGQTGAGSILADLSRQAEWYGQRGENAEAFAGLLSSRIKTLRDIETTPRERIAMSFGGAIYRGATDIERQQAGAAADVLEKMMPDLLQAMKDGLEETKKTNTLLEKAQATPSPTAVRENRNQHGPGRALSFWEAPFGYTAR